MTWWLQLSKLLHETSWNLSIFWAHLSFCFYICMYIYICIHVCVCLFMMTNYRSLSVYLILEVEWLWPMCQTRAGWNVGFFYWDQFADEVSGSGQLGCLVRSSSSRSLAWSWIFESFDHDLQWSTIIYNDLWWSMMIYDGLHLLGPHGSCEECARDAEQKLWPGLIGPWPKRWQGGRTT